MDSQSKNKPTTPVYEYRNRNSRTGLARRLGFESVADLSKNREKIVNEQRKKLGSMNIISKNKHNNGSKIGFGHGNKKKGDGKSLRTRKLLIESKWNTKPTKRTQKQKLQPPKTKSLEDLDKEMESYFNPQLPEQENEKKTNEQLNKEMDDYMTDK
ncbi:hypothetical protein QEN19_003984 [Hanseniaspora menglaensis]